MVFAGSILIVIATALLPFNPAPENVIIRFIASLQFLPVFLSLLSFVIGMGIVRSTTRLYALPIRLLAYSMLGWAISFIGVNVAILAGSSLPAELGWSFIAAFSVAQLLEFASAFYFKKSAAE
jgi:hypothetical protein